MVKQAEDWEFGGLYHHRQGRMDIVEILRTTILALYFPSKAIE
jgi:hypothetical protein